MDKHKLAVTAEKKFYGVDTRLRCWRRRCRTFNTLPDPEASNSTTSGNLNNSRLARVTSIRKFY